MNTRDETIKRIKTALQKRSGKTWSVTAGRGTDWGWLTIDAPPKRKTAHWSLKAGTCTQNPEDYEERDTGEAGGHITPADRAELQTLLGLPDPVHHQGESIPSGGNFYAEYIDRAEGRTPAKLGKIYWD